MDAAQIIQLGREYSNFTDTDQYTNSQALTDLNIVYRNCIASINQDVNEDLFATDWYTSSVTGQLEYTMPQVNNSTGTNGLGNLLGVFINYNPVISGTGTIAVTA